MPAGKTVMIRISKKNIAATFAILVACGAMLQSTEFAHAGKSAAGNSSGSVSGMDLGSGR